MKNKLQNLNKWFYNQNYFENQIYKLVILIFAKKKKKQ